MAALAFLDNCDRPCTYAHTQHTLFTAMCTHKGGGKRPHLILWGSHGISKSFLLDLCSNLLCPHTIVKRTHVSKQFTFGDADNRDSIAACCVFTNDEAKPSDIGIYSKDAQNSDADTSFLKESLTNHELTSQVRWA